MDPFTMFISAIGLLGVFKAEVHERESRDFDAYIDWLRRQEHQQLVDLIVGNDELSRSLRVLVEDQHGQVMAKLEELDKVLTDVASQFADFEPLAKAVKSEAGLPDQVVSILRQFNEANAVTLHDVTHSGSGDGGSYMFIGGGGGNLRIDDPRFIKADLFLLRDLGLLRLSHNRNGKCVFTITRAGAAVGGHSA